MKKLLLSTVACLTIAVSIKAQQVQPCGTYQAREIYLKKVPGYAAKLQAATAASDAEYQAYLNSMASSKTSSLSSSYTFTIPVVFHVLHLGEDVGTGTNVSDAALINALAQVNRDYARDNSDTSSIDPLFKPLYVNSNMHFELAKKDPMGNCTNGIVRHYDEKTNWSQADLFNYKYSTMAAGNWNPSKYLNIYIVKNIIDDGGAIGIVVGYTHLPGTAPIDPSDAIVYHYGFLGGLNARSLSHEIGHWFGLSHTFGGSNSPGFECGNDDIADTPPTTGFFSTCPKPASYLVSPSVTNPVDSSDIVKVTFGAPSNPVGLLTCTTSLNSLTGNVIKPLFALVATTVTPKADTVIYTAIGVAGAYSDFSGLYGNDFNSGTTNTLTVKSIAKYTDNNFIGIYFDKNKNGNFTDLGENILVSSASLFGPQTFTTTVSLSGGMYGIYRMRIITANTPVTGPTMTPSKGEIEDYNFNIGTTPSPTTGINLTMASCSDKRPNIENIMDYSSCPKMFTQGQTTKMRLSAQSMVSYRQLLVDTNNLVRTGLLTYTVNTSISPNDTVYFATGVSPCAPIADFAVNNFISCAGQALTFNSTTYNTSVPTTFLWVFEGGTPSTSTLSTQTVTYTTPGTYSVSLTVSNANGTSTKSVANYVKTNWNAGPSNLPYSEGFESGQWWPAGFVVENPDLNSPGWALSSYGNSSAYSLVLGNANQVSNFPGYNANVDILNLPPFDFTNTTNISISFDYAFARKTGVVADTFKLQYSLDCGGSWKTITGLTATTMAAASGGTVNAPFIPWSSSPANSPWEPKSYPSVILNVLNNKRDVRFRMWFQNDISTGKSQNLYIDNINISGTVGLNEFENSLGLSIYPNPTSATAVVEFTSPSSSKVNITVFDVTGRVVEQSTINGDAGITTKHTVNSSNHLISGIYFISINIDGRKLVKKLIIE
ncbi:MAG: T9SS type A sorting domain-containing protein [Burkholderiales bacterium]|nr:T9SS type A sorting domain-containing protein [Bacteroidia bacterium]